MFKKIEELWQVRSSFIKFFIISKIFDIGKSVNEVAISDYMHHFPLLMIKQIILNGVVTFMTIPTVLL